MRTSLVEGHQSLNVVGESHYQNNLWRIVGEKPGGVDRVGHDVYAMLLAEDDSPYDANAVSVWIDGLRVGHLSREDAARLRPGLLDLQAKHGTPIALEGEIAGGGIRQDGPGMLGVFLYYEAEEFGLPKTRSVRPAEGRLRTALSDALSSDAADDSYDLAWMREIPADDAHAIPYLRKLLGVEADVLSRHYLHRELEAALYRCRDVCGSALDEYDAACRQHDAEMDAIRTSCIAKWGKVPLLETYRQMAIRQQKARDYSAALWWAERGLALYGADAARPEAVEDLRRRAAGYRAKLPAR